MELLNEQQVDLVASQDRIEAKHAVLLIDPFESWGALESK